MAKNNNQIIRKAIEDERIYAYEVAELLGVSEATYGRMMRKELPVSEQKRIAKMIKEKTNGKQ